jgi:hypothetical protein
MPMNIAEMTAAMAVRVLICPMTPIGHLNVRAMSIRRRPVRTPRGPVANWEKANEGRNSLPDERSSVRGELPIIFYHYSSLFFTP